MMVQPSQKRKDSGSQIGSGTVTVTVVDLHIDSMSAELLTWQADLKPQHS
jgi:hypothetical protein